MLMERLGHSGRTRPCQQVDHLGVRGLLEVPIVDADGEERRRRVQADDLVHVGPQLVERFRRGDRHGKDRVLRSGPAQRLQRRLDGATGRQRTRMQLFDLWVQHYSAIDDADKNLLPLRPVYFRAPRD